MAAKWDVKMADHYGRGTFQLTKVSEVDDDELAERCEESSARKAIFEELFKEALAFFGANYVSIACFAGTFCRKLPLVMTPYLIISPPLQPPVSIFKAAKGDNSGNH
jgi:hypothetical protein